MRVLLVEDEDGMAANVRTALRKHDIVVDHAPNLEIAREAAINNVHDAVLLDRKLPDGDGLSFIPLMRSLRPSVPIIVLSAMGASTDRIAGLDNGADDYLGKPFSLDELVARLRAVMRRGATVMPSEIVVGALTYDTEERHVTVSGSMLELPRRELLVIETLVRRAGRTVSRESLEEAVYGFDDEIASNSLDAHISRLRKRLIESGAGVEIHTMRGVGYLLKASHS